VDVRHNYNKTPIDPGLVGSPREKDTWDLLAKPVEANELLEKLALLEQTTVAEGPASPSTTAAGKD